MPENPLEREGLSEDTEIFLDSMSDRYVPEELVIMVLFFELAQKRLEEAERFAASCDAVGAERSDGATHNID